MRHDETALQAWLTGWLPSQRWFADKARPIAQCRLIASAPIGQVSELAVVRITFHVGEDADYVVPIERSALVETTDSPAFTSWLGSILDGATPAPHGIHRDTFVGDSPAIAALPAKPLGLEQSNTSIRFGDAWVVKLNRRLSYGPSPELELAPLLNRWTGGRCAPRTVAALHVTTDRGTAALAMQAELVHNHGDGWAIVLAGIRRVLSGGGSLERDPETLGEVRAVAELTADMHSALAGDPWTAILAPERIDPSLAEEWRHRGVAGLPHALALVDAARATLSGRSKTMADLVTGEIPTLSRQLDGFAALIGSQRTRVHGDYHLGQVLRTPQARYVAIDFDGEPQRSLSERRDKYSPLRDVAGMMRSLSYLVGTLQAEQEGLVDDAALPAWERAARAIFLETYLGRLRANGARLLPEEPERVRLALVALEAEKAIYEVVYEVNNRPEWLWIPLGQLVRMA